MEGTGPVAGLGSDPREENPAGACGRESNEHEAVLRRRITFTLKDNGSNNSLSRVFTICTQSSRLPMPEFQN